MSESSPRRTGTNPEFSFHSAPVLKMRVVEPLKRAFVPLMVLASVGGAAFAAKQVWAPAGSSLVCGSVGDSWRAACRETANGPAKARTVSAGDPSTTGVVDETKGKKRSTTAKSPEPAVVEVAKLQPEAPAKNPGSPNAARAPLNPVDESRDLAGSIEPLSPASKPAAAIAPAAPPARPVETAAAPASHVKQPEPDRSAVGSPPDRTIVVARAPEPPVMAPSRPKLSFEADRPVAARPVEPAPSAPKADTAAPAPTPAKRAEAPVEVAPPVRLRAPSPPADTKPPAAVRAPEVVREARPPASPDRAVRELASREISAPVRRVRPRAVDPIEPPARAAQGNAFPPEFLRELRGYNSGYRARLEDRRAVAYASAGQAPSRRVRPGRDEFPPEFAQVLRSYNGALLPW